MVPTHTTYSRIKKFTQSFIVKRDYVVVIRMLQGTRHRGGRSANQCYKATCALNQGEAYTKYDFHHKFDTMH